MREKIDHTNLTEEFIPTSDMSNKIQKYVHMAEVNGKITIYETIFPGMRAKRTFVKKDQFETIMSRRRKYRERIAKKDTSTPSEETNQSDYLKTISDTLTEISANISTIKSQLGIIAHHSYITHKTVCALATAWDVKVNLDDTLDD